MQWQANQWRPNFFVERWLQDGMNLIKRALTSWLGHKLPDAFIERSVKDHINMDLIAGAYWLYSPRLLSNRALRGTKVLHSCCASLCKTNSLFA
jgi:hypothetical protein